MPKFSTWPISSERFAQIDKGTASSGTVTFDYSQGVRQKLAVGGPLSIAFINWPDSGDEGEMKIQIVNGRAGMITWPTINWMLGNGASSPIFTDMGVTLAISGSNFIWIWTSDGGTTLYGAAM